MDYISQTKEKPDSLLAVPSPVEETKLGLPPAVLAGLAVVVPFLGSILGLVEKNQPYVKHYAVQSLIFWLGAFLAGYLNRILLSGSGPLGMLLTIVFAIPMILILLVLCFFLAVLAYHAFSGIVYYLPYTRKYLPPLLTPMKRAAEAANTVAAKRK
jgi:hypothetical protein